ncbi:MAG: hypothetical protein L6437_06545 [Kiritimatiellae bacterium]|nr:hypothetical protein [Kiritimatiellia bacterium]
MKGICRLLVFAACCWSLTAAGEQARGGKIISVSEAKTPPVIDGVLDDECWKTAEAGEDFIPVSALPPERTVIRLAYDRKHLYFGVECFVKDSERMRQQAAEMRAKAGFTEGFVNISDFAYKWEVELFIDPGATQCNYYQLLMNAGGQICGQYKGNWNPFAVKPEFKARVHARGWTGEMILPVDGMPGVELKAGDEWGLNVARRDMENVVIWKDVGSVYNEPRRFGRMVIGDYRTWWESVWIKGVMVELGRMAGDMGRFGAKAPYLPAMFAVTQEKAREVNGRAQGIDFSRRSGFVPLYDVYSLFYGGFHRLDALYRTLGADAKIW